MELLIISFQMAVTAAYMTSRKNIPTWTPREQKQCILGGTTRPQGNAENGKISHG